MYEGPRFPRRGCSLARSDGFWDRVLSELLGGALTISALRSRLWMMGALVEDAGALCIIFLGQLASGKGNLGSECTRDIVGWGLLWSIQHG
jgi:hypothetical protein